MIIHLRCLFLFLIFCSSPLFSQNLVVDGAIVTSNANWGGGANEEAPYNSGTFENVYLGTGCGSNYVMEADLASNPFQVVNGFVPGAQYVITFRYAYRSTCAPSVDPTNLVIQFTDATSVLNVTLPVPSSVNTLKPVSYTFTNNASLSHTLKFSNPGNANTCGIIVDDISIVRVTSPGGVGSTNLSAWYRAGTIAAADGLYVYAWISMGNNNIAAVPPCSAPPVYKTGLASMASSLVANFNPYVTFDGSSQYLQQTSTYLNLGDLSSGGAGSSYFSAYAGGSSGRSVFGHKGTGNSRVLAKTNEIAFGNTAAVGTNNNTTFTGSSRMNIPSVNGKSNGLVVKDLNGAGQSAANGTADADYLTIGVNRNNAGTYSQYFNGAISEIILYNTILSNTQMQQVRSYLAAKYGVTLNDNSATAGIDERNYLATNGTTNYWNYASNSAYHNNVTVIGRDDNTDLSQLKSISTDADANGLTGGNAMLIIHTPAFSSDKSFFAAGHNGVASAVNELTDIPATIQSRMQRSWKFQKTGAGVAGTVTVTFDMTGFSPLTGSDLRLLVSTATTFGTATTTIITGSYSAPYFTASLPTTGGAYFTVGSINKIQTPLPVELLSFEARECDKDVCLDWRTASETNNDFFTIDKTKDGVHFEYVATVDGAGTSTSVSNYTSIDPVPYEGLSYYRLKQTDFNGAFSYSDLEPVRFSTATDFSFDVFPNPSEGEQLSIALNAAKNEEILVVVYDARGREYYSKVIVSSKTGNAVYGLDPTNKLAAGIYMIMATSGQNMISKKLVVQ